MVLAAQTKAHPDFPGPAFRCPGSQVRMTMRLSAKAPITDTRPRNPGSSAPGRQRAADHRGVSTRAPSVWRQVLGGDPPLLPCLVPVLGSQLSSAPGRSRRPHRYRRAGVAANSEPAYLDPSLSFLLTKPRGAPPVLKARALHSPSEHTSGHTCKTTGNF